MESLHTSDSIETSIATTAELSEQPETHMNDEMDAALSSELANTDDEKHTAQQGTVDAYTKSLIEMQYTIYEKYVPYITMELAKYKSPLTAEMIIKSSVINQVPLIYLMAFMKNDSAYGTAGLGKKTKNPGNVGNMDDGSTKTNHTREAGVDLCAKHLAKVIKAYQIAFQTHDIPTAYEIATGVSTKHKQKFHGVYMTEPAGPKRVHAIAAKLAATAVQAGLA